MKRGPHAPSHCVTHPGPYMATAAIHHKQRLFDTPENLTLVENSLLETLEEYGWQVQARADFSDRYHFVGFSPEEGNDVLRMATTLHASPSRVR